MVAIFYKLQVQGSHSNLPCSTYGMLYSTVISLLLNCTCLPKRSLSLFVAGESNALPGLPRDRTLQARLLQPIRSISLSFVRLSDLRTDLVLHDVARLKKCSCGYNSNETLMMTDSCANVPRQTDVCECANKTRTRCAMVQPDSRRLFALSVVLLSHMMFFSILILE